MFLSMRETQVGICMGNSSISSESWLSERAHLKCCGEMRVLKKGWGRIKEEESEEKAEEEASAGKRERKKE